MTYTVKRGQSVCHNYRHPRLYSRIRACCKRGNRGSHRRLPRFSGGSSGTQPRLQTRNGQYRRMGGDSEGMEEAVSLCCDNSLSPPFFPQNQRSVQKWQRNSPKCRGKDMGYLSFRYPSPVFPAYPASQRMGSEARRNGTRQRKNFGTVRKSIPVQSSFLYSRCLSYK